jgi:hypothetical protein
MPDDIFGIVQALFVIAYMFVLRIGVPILVTLMIGAWLKRVLEEHDEKPETAPVTLKGGQHCWDVSKTRDTEQAQAVAAQRADLPCWLALQVSGAGLKEMCYACPVFTSSAPAIAKA